jgi:DNA-binding PucR family transcriptional regulator
LDYLCRNNWNPNAFIAVGEPADGVEGWRLTHHQARAALRFARLDPDGPVRYSEVALEASLSRDELLSASLRRLYLKPLERTRDSGKHLRDTLAAYFACGRNISSTAVSLNVDRRTVSNRIRTAERLFGHPLEAIAPQLELALRLHNLDGLPHA